MTEYLLNSDHDAPSLNDVKYPFLLYADDVVLISKSKRGLNNMIETLEIFCADNDLEINSDKCEYMIVNNCRKQPDDFVLINSNRVKNVQVIRYLGVWFNRKGSWNRHSDISLARMNLSLNCAKYIFSKGPDKRTDFARQLLDTFVSPIMTFGSHVWKVSKYDKFDSVRSLFLKKVLGQPLKSRNVSTLFEAGCICSECLIAYHVANFYARCLTNDRLLHVRKIIFSKLRDVNSRVYKDMDFLAKFNLANVLFDAPKVVLEDKKSIKLMLRGKCFDLHVKDDRLGADSQYYATNKTMVSPEYLRKCDAETRNMLFMVRTGNWRKLPKLLDFMFPRGAARMCDKCGVALNTEHLMELCVALRGRRNTLKKENGLGPNDKITWLFDDPRDPHDFVFFFAVIC